jgi:hypothetical protein
MPSKLPRNPKSASSSLSFGPGVARERGHESILAGEPYAVGVRQGLGGSLAAGLDLERDLFVDVFTTEDARIGVASFLEHGPGQATFSGT